MNAIGKQFKSDIIMLYTKVIADENCQNSARSTNRGRARKRSTVLGDSGAVSRDESFQIRPAFSPNPIRDWLSLGLRGWRSPKMHFCHLPCWKQLLPSSHACMVFHPCNFEIFKTVMKHYRAQNSFQLSPQMRKGKIKRQFQNFTIYKDLYGKPSKRD